MAEIAIKLHVDMTELDEAITKAKELKDLSMALAAALDLLNTGKATINQIRETFGLSTINETGADQYLKKLDGVAGDRQVKVSVDGVKIAKECYEAACD